MTFFDDNTKKSRWWNRNYFYLGTIVWLAINFLLFAYLGNDWVPSGNRSPQWTGLITYENIRAGFLSSFAHADRFHVLGNMLCLIICGLYLERKQGTLEFVFFIPLMAFFTAIAISANDFSRGGIGFSGVNFGMYGWIIVDYVFSFGKAKRTKINIIFGAIILAVIYFAACCKDFETFKYAWYPHDLLYNLAHYSGFLVGAILALFVNICELKVLKEYANRSTNNPPLTHNPKMPYKIVYIIALVLDMLLIATTIGCCVAVA